MNIANLITPELTVSKSNATSKKQVLKEVSQLVSEADSRFKSTEILDALVQRERLGSTALGHGVAIPHARISKLTNTLCVLITLAEAIEYDSEEKQQVDIIFGLLAPENATEQHLNILADLSNKLKDEHYRDLLRQANTNEELYKAAVGKQKTEV